MQPVGLCKKHAPSPYPKTISGEGIYQAVKGKPAMPKYTNYDDDGDDDKGTDYDANTESSIDSSRD